MKLISPEGGFEKHHNISAHGSLSSSSCKHDQKCIWQTYATQGRWRRSHSALYGPILLPAWGLADWTILVRLPGSSSWPTLIPQAAKLSGPPGWLLGTFQFARCEESHLVPWWVRGRQGKTHNTSVELCIGALHTINSWCMYNLQYIKLITVQTHIIGSL